MKLASWRKGKAVVKGKMGDGRGCSCETGVRPSFEWNSLRGLKFRRCSVALWLAEERWNENHSKLLTPAQELCRNAQPSSGVVEQSPLSSCVYSSNPTGTVGRGGGGGGRRGREHRERERGRRERHEREGGREEGKSSEQRCSLKMKWISVFLHSGKRVHKHCF